MDNANTILIVDDQLSARETMAAVLTGQGYNLLFAENGLDGIKQAKATLPDLIILDIMMPGMDGFEVCERLRTDLQLAEVPIIMLTSLDDFETRVRGLEAGADDFVSKPFNRVELLARIRTITRLNRYRRLMQERTKFEWVVDQSKDGYLVIDDQGVITYANPQARLYFSLPLGSDSAINEPFLELARHQYRFEPDGAWLTWPEKPATVGPRYLVRPESLSSHAFWLQVDTLPISGSSAGAWVVQLTDVTAQKILERDMRGFHVMVSHKLRTPLAGILGSLKLLANSGASLSPEKVMSLSQLALDNVERLYHSMGDVLEFLSTPFASQSQIKFNLSTLETTATEIADTLHINLAQVNCPMPLQNSWLQLSHRAMELVLWEVLENTKKFHPQQSPNVIITVAEKSNGNVTVSIVDDGAGLSPEQLTQIWSPYYQGDKYATGEIKGMGLGLAMVATMVREVGGQTHAYNNKNATGLVIELILPLVKDLDVVFNG